jgi:integrase
MRHQEGSIRKDKARGVWYGVYREDRLQPDGSVKRVQRVVKLADICNRYRSESDVRPLLDAILAPLNDGKVDVRSTMTVAQFVENGWLPHCEQVLAPASMDHYKKGWRYLKPYIGAKALRDVRAADASDLLDSMRKQGIGHRCVKQAKTTGSAIFTRALACSIIDGNNPFKLAALPKRRKKKSAKPTTTVQDVWAMLQALKGHPKAQAAIGLTWFGGLNPSEARGALWENYDGVSLKITQSVWRTHTGSTKTEAREAPIPIIGPLGAILSQVRAADGNPLTGPILRGKKGQPLNLDNLSRRVIKPALQAAGLPWKDAYRANRRSVSTTATALAKDNGLAAKGLLRHATLATTDRNYIQTVPAETLAAMSELERQFAECDANCDAKVSHGVVN